MSAFTESAFVKKLTDLNLSQQSIQTLSLWLIHHRKHNGVIVKTWLRELKNASENRKLILMYLANDVIQNSKKKGPEYGRQFTTVLPEAFAHIAESCKSDRVIGGVGRMLCIWDERGVYDEKIIEEYRSRLNKDKKEGDKVKSIDGNGAGTNKNESTSTVHKSKSSEKHRKHDDNRHKYDPSSSSSRKHASSSSSSNHEKKRSRTSNNSGHAANDNGVNNSPDVNTSLDDSSYVPSGDPPQSEDLIRALKNIENSASSDAAMRERIAHLPPEISELTYLNKLEDKEQASRLAVQVNEAVDLLNDYNSRLSAEIEERNKLSTMLRDYRAEQKMLLAKTEKKLEDYKKKLSQMASIQKNIRDHLSNLPDLTQLPNVTELAPLPSAGDLFNK